MVDATGAGDLFAAGFLVAIARGADYRTAARLGALAAAEVIVEEQAGPNQPGRALLRRMRQHEAHRPDDMRRGCEQNFPLDQRLSHQAKLVIFQIAQAAMHELARARGRTFGEIVLLAEQHLQATTGGIARDTSSVDSAADDGDINKPVIPGRDRRSARHRFLLSFFFLRGAAFADFVFGDDVCRP